MSMQQESACFASFKKTLWLCGLLTSLKFASIWYYYVPPFNVVIRLAMLLIFIWLCATTIRGFLSSSWQLSGLALVFSACLIFAPFMNDVRALGVRYRAEFELRNWSTLLDPSAQNTVKRVRLSSAMGEEVFLGKGAIPNADLFVSIKKIDGGCYSESTQITSYDYVFYEVCPSGAGTLIVSIFLLNF